MIVGLKAHQLSSAVESMQPLLGNDTAIVTAVNGIPYWYFYRHGGAVEGSTLESVDPGGRQWRELRPERAIGCIVYPATEVVEPGVIRHVYGDKFPVGEPSGERTARVEKISNLFEAAGLKAPVIDNIRDEIWLKLWGNVSFNPISALTHATLDVITTDPGTRAVAKAMMLEAKEVADQQGIGFRVDVERRIEGARKVGAHKTSMCRTLSAGGPWKSIRSSRSCRRWGVCRASRHPPSTLSWPSCSNARELRAFTTTDLRRCRHASLDPFRTPRRPGLRDARR